MWAHDARYVIHRHHTDFYQGLGGYGVELFFAISGILISWRILQDERRQGHFSLKSFYIRRFFRIQPPQWVYLGVVALLMGLGVLPTANWRYWWAALLMFENFLWHNLHIEPVVRASYLVGHFWTLAVEEHFYLLISLFFFLVKKHRAIVLAVLFTLLVVGQQVATELHHWSDDVSNRRTYWALQYLLFPALIALLLQYSSFQQFARRWWKPWLAYAVTLAAMCVHQLIFFPMTALLSRESIVVNGGVLSYSFTGWVLATTLHPASLTTRFLELKPLRFIGRLSYSLYLWHLLFFGGGAPERCTWHWLTVLNRPPLHYACSLFMAMVSYYFIEKPMIRLGHRLAPPATPGHRDLSKDVPLLSVA